MLCKRLRRPQISEDRVRVGVRARARAGVRARVRVRVRARDQMSWRSLARGPLLPCIVRRDWVSLHHNEDAEGEPSLSPSQVRHIPDMLLNIQSAETHSECLYTRWSTTLNLPSLKPGLV